jgi:hypothetical protein
MSTTTRSGCPSAGGRTNPSGVVAFFKPIRMAVPASDTDVKMSVTRLSPTNSVVIAGDFRAPGR